MYGGGVNMEVLFISIILLILGLTNVIAFKWAGRDRVRRVLSGVIVILLSPFIFKLSFDVIGSFDSGGFGAAAVTLIYSTLFFINGIIIILIGIATSNVKKST